MNEIIMVVGGSSSGKSAFAEKKARELSQAGKIQVIYLATATIWDEEFARRVQKHRDRRPSTWKTIEEPYDLHLQLQRARKEPVVFLIDGIGTWVTNLMYRDKQPPFHWNEQAQRYFDEQLQYFIASMEDINGTIILVADEVGMAIVPASPEGRIFRDLNGQTNQILAERADRVYLLSCGIPLQIKG